MKRFISILLIVIMLFSTASLTFGATWKQEHAADVLYDLGLFAGTGTDENGDPIYSLDKAPTRQEAITVLVKLLGKQEEALNGSWETPFTDVANWAKPFVGYAYANGITSGVSATEFGATRNVTVAQYLTFVLAALGYDSKTDFLWSQSWKLADEIGLTDGSYNANTKTFLRGDITLISNSALEMKMKDSDETLADKLIENGVFTEEQYKDIPEEPEILESQTFDFRDVYFVIDGERTKWEGRYRGERGVHDVEVFWKNGNPLVFDDYDVEIENIPDGRTKSKVWKNDDGTFSFDLRGDSTAISVYYVTSRERIVEEDGSERIQVSRTKTTLGIDEERTYEGVYFIEDGETFLPNNNIGTNFHDYFVCDVYCDGKLIDDYQVTVSETAPAEASIQADGTLLLKYTTDYGRGTFTITYGNQSATYTIYRY